MGEEIAAAGLPRSMSKKAKARIAARKAITEALLVKEVKVPLISIRPTMAISIPAISVK